MRYGDPRLVGIEKRASEKNKKYKWNILAPLKIHNTHVKAILEGEMEDRQARGGHTREDNIKRCTNSSQAAIDI